MNIKKIILITLSLQSLMVVSTSMLDMRRKTSSPLLYSMMDMFEQKEGRDYYMSASIFGSNSFDSNDMAETLTISGKSYFTLNESGPTSSLKVHADLNPIWIQLSTVGTGGGGDYKSTVELDPQVKIAGSLLHFYTKCNKYFLDVRSAILQCRTQVKIIETGGGNGAGSINSFEDAMNSSTWNYGKMGSEQKKVGLDNIQCKFGFFHKFGNDETSKKRLAAYAIAEIPTGKGTKAEWVFEPRVGHNHLGLGFGIDEYITTETTQLQIGISYRYLFGAREKRSFDLKDKPFSKYIRVLSIPTSTAASGTASPGINSLTLDTTVTPRCHLNATVRWLKRWKKFECEVGYNLFVRRKEELSNIAAFANEFGIYDLYAAGGKTLNAANMATAMNATVGALAVTPGVALTHNDLDLESAAVDKIITSSFSARAGYVGKTVLCGLGCSADAAHSKSAYASWNAWANFGLLF